MELLHNELTEKIIKCFYNVYNSLGYGFLEKVYERSLVIVLRESGLDAQPQQPINVYFQKHLVGEYYADIVVNNLIILELKNNEYICPEDEAQLLNYLRATDKEVGLLLNFGDKPEVRRKVFSNKRKNLPPTFSD